MAIKINKLRQLMNVLPDEASICNWIAWEWWNVR